MERTNVTRHISGRNNEVLKGRVGIRLRNACEYPEEHWSKILLGLETHVASLCAGNERLDLNVDKLRSIAIAAKNVGVWRVAKGNNRDITTAAQFPCNKELT